MASDISSDIIFSLYWSPAAPPYPDIRESFREIGPKRRSIMAEDPESGLSVGHLYTGGSLLAKTTITVLLHGTKQPGVLAQDSYKWSLCSSERLTVAWEGTSWYLQSSGMWQRECLCIVLSMTSLWSLLDLMNCMRMKTGSAGLFILRADSA